MKKLAFFTLFLIISCNSKVASKNISDENRSGAINEGFFKSEIRAGDYELNITDNKAFRDFSINFLEKENEMFVELIEFLTNQIAFSPLIDIIATKDQIKESISIIEKLDEEGFYFDNTSYEEKNQILLKNQQNFQRIKRHFYSLISNFLNTAKFIVSKNHSGNYNFKILLKIKGKVHDKLMKYSNSKNVLKITNFSGSETGMLEIGNEKIEVKGILNAGKLQNILDDFYLRIKGKNNQARIFTLKGNKYFNFYIDYEAASSSKMSSKAKDKLIEYFNLEIPFDLDKSQLIYNEEQNNYELNLYINLIDKNNEYIASKISLRIDLEGNILQNNKKLDFMKLERIN